jgi:hypothetical protein
LLLVRRHPTREVLYAATATRTVLLLPEGMTIRDAVLVLGDSISEDERWRVLAYAERDVLAV